jgi:AcrR family transcriptional regulator
MPKQVDHGQRRSQIAAAVARIAVTEGLQGVSFRQVAAEAGMSVSLIQHYFGTKERLLVEALDIQSAALGSQIGRRLEALGEGAPPAQRLGVVTDAFLPADDERRGSMLLYLGFAGAALTDDSLKTADAFREGDKLRGALALELERARFDEQLAVGVDPDTEAQSILALILGLALSVLLDQMTADAARHVIDLHLRRLFPTVP